VPPPVLSPCKRLCAIDHVTRLCAGCGRSLEEIANWLRYDHARQRKIMALLPERLAAMERANRNPLP
jgi:predicted Fe-S protein YdhL (DUF1289 family)